MFTIDNHVAYDEEGYLHSVEECGENHEQRSVRFCSLLQTRLMEDEPLSGFLVMILPYNLIFCRTCE